MPEELKTLTPTFIIYLAGTRFSVDQESAVKQIVISDRVDAPATCRIVMSDDGHRWQDSADLGEGQQISVQLGYKDHVAEAFNGEILGMETELRKNAASTVTLLCANGLHRLFRNRQHRLFGETSDADIISTIADEAGLSVEADSIGTDRLFLAQQGMTDYDFLMAMAKRYGCALWVKDQTLNFKRVTNEGSPEIIVEWGKTLNEFTGVSDCGKLLSSVEVHGWDAQAGTAFVGTAAVADVSPVGGSTIGGSTGEENFGASLLAVTDLEVADQSAAEQLALEALTADSLGFIQAQGSCEGDPALRSGADLNVKEVGGRFSGIYQIREVRHQFNAGAGYTTYFSLRRNAV